MSKRRTSRRPGRDAAAPEDDQALWQAFAKSIDPLDLKGRVPDTDSAILDEMLRKEAANRAGERGAARPRTNHQTKPVETASLRGRAVEPVVPVPQIPAGSMTAKDVRRIGKGRREIDARIDLHGMRQSEAHGALRVFLFRSIAKGHRLVLVITGKGTSERASQAGERFGTFVHEGGVGRGVLRRNVPLWLDEPDLRAIVVGYTAAHIRHGGDGALYVQLRKSRV